jgi:cytochrome d ubiquinol oxidase subunit I
MSNYVVVDRLQFAFTITFHYLFPILTMGLGLFIAWLKSVSYLGREDHWFPLLRKSEAERERYEAATRFWAKIFAVNFGVGVVTGIPMEFQFGTNWASFSNYAGGVIGQTLAMEGVLAFFAESVFLGIFLAGRNRVSPRVHWLSALFVFFGSWLSGFFIIATDAWMQHPVAYTVTHGRAELNSLSGLLANKWVFWQYAHNMSGAAITGSFVVAAIGGLYLLLDRHHDVARIFLRVGVVGAFVFCLLQIFPTGDSSARNVATYQPTAFAAMEGMFKTEKGAPLVIIGTPDTTRRTLESSIALPHFLSFLTSHRWNQTLRGLDSFPVRQWPDSVPLVYYAYHIMVGLGTILFAIAAIALLLLWRGRLYSARPVLWALMIAAPFTYIANIAGWVTAETARQPWIVFGLMRTAEGASPDSSVPSGATIFTLLGFLGLYLLIAILYVVLVLRIIAQGPEDVPEAPASAPSGAAGATA